MLVCEHDGSKVGDDVGVSVCSTFLDSSITATDFYVNRLPSHNKLFSQGPYFRMSENCDSGNKKKRKERD
ncbi:hypothetical protein WN55_10574 [Dufourea novaeangliae]|uniref:Uncharacterized protein n=1 Tax=Dufourea novaeangliae TaxID=178035 RepID=A0A154P494_DUFNO|nr:hypothetical protein WN55_10574 [Dufourea novaeangliae]